MSTAKPLPVIITNVDGQFPSGPSSALSNLNTYASQILDKNISTNSKLDTISNQTQTLNTTATNINTSLQTLKTNIQNIKTEVQDINTNTYTKTEVNDALALKADKATTYTKTEVNDALALKADKATTYTKTEVDNLIPDLSIYAKKNDANQTIRTGIVSCVTYQNPNGKSVIYIADASAYTTRPFLATDATNGGTMTYSYMSGNRSGYAYIGLWRDNYYPHLTMTKTQTTFNRSSVFSEVVTFNNDVTFNDVALLMSTLTIDSKPINTIVRSEDAITPSDMNIPTSLWTQNKLDTKADQTNTYTKAEVDTQLTNYYTKTQIDTTLNNYYTKTEVYTKAEVDTLLTNYYTKTDLNNLLQLNNLSKIILNYDRTSSTSFNKAALFLFSSIDSFSQKLYLCSQSRTYSYNGKILIISPSASYRYIEILNNTAFIPQGYWYTLLPDNNFKTIKITQNNREFHSCFYEIPIVVGTPNYIPPVNSIDSVSSSNFSLQLSFTYTFNNLPQSETKQYGIQSIMTEIATMTGNDVLNRNKDRQGFYFICNGKTANQNTRNYQTTVRWLFLGKRQSYSYSSNNGSVFYIPFSYNRWEMWYGQFKFKAANGNVPAFYNHSFEINIPSAQRISGGPDLDNFAIEIADFTMACDIFFSTLTNLN